MSKELDSGGNKRKRSPKENEGKNNQKKTLLSYFHSSKNEGPEKLNETDFKSEISISEVSEEKLSESMELQGNMDIVDEKTEPEKNSQKISQSAFELKSSINGSENLDETEVKSETSSENQIEASTSTVKTSKTEESQDNVKSVDGMKEPEHEKTNQESFEVASTSAIHDEGSKNLNGTDVKPEISISESQTSASTSEVKTSENMELQDIVKNGDDNKGQEETNQESLQIDSVVNETESLNETEVKPGTSSETQPLASTSGVKENENVDNQNNVDSIDEVKEPEEPSQDSSQTAVKSKPYVDWRSDCYSVTSLPTKARKEGLFTDIQFVMGKEDKRREFHAHKSILACASPVFEEMFFGPLPEERNIIETDDDPDAFEMLLNCIYGSRNFLHHDKPLASVCKFSMIGSKYLIPNIQETLESYIFFHSITEDDFWDVFQVSNFNSLWPLFCDKLESYIMENAEELVPSEKFLNVPEIIVKSVLKMDKLNIKEYPLLVGVTKWIYHNKDQVTAEILKEFYKYIRFSRLSAHNLIEFTDSFPEALDAETFFQILQHINNKSGHDLPEWCSTNNKSRIKALEISKHERACSCSDCNGDSDGDTVCSIQ